MNNPLPLIALAWLTVSTSLFAQADRPKELEFYGVLRSANGRPVSGCEVTITAPASNRYERFFAREATAVAPAKLTTSTASDGTFRFKVDLTDRKWIGAGEGLIVARGVSGEMALQPYRLSRGLVDLPIEIALPTPAKVFVRIVNLAGQPQVGVQVTPARYGKSNVPPTIAEVVPAITNAEGFAELPAANQPLAAVCAASENLGQQFLLAQGDTDGKLKAVAQTTVVRRLRCTPPEGVQPTEIGRIQWCIVSFRKSNEQMELAWRRVTTNGTEPVDIALPEGSIVAFNDIHSGHGWLPSDRGFELAAQDHIDLKLQRALHVVGQVVAKENGQPLAGICLQESYSDETTISGDDGSFEMWLPSVSDGTYPIDPLEEYFYEQAFYARPEAEHAPGEAKIKTFELTRSTVTIGTVLDADGRPVAGVSVKSESKQERFTNNHEFLTDRNGSFRLNNIADGTPVKLKVMDRRGVTASPLEVTASPSESPTIRLIKPAPKRFQGRVVDTEGKPIGNATVEIQLGRVVVAEGYRPADYMMENAFGNASSHRSRFTTDASGRFESDDCIDWENVFSLKLTHPRHYETLTWVRRVDKTPAAQPSYDFGDVTMRAAPEPQKFIVQVQDKSGKPVANAKVLFIQGRDYADQATTDTSGRVLFEGKRTAGIVAARDQQRVAFKTLTGDQPQLALNIDAIPADQPWHTFPGDLAQRRAVAGKLLKKFELAKTLDLSNASDGEVVNVLDAVLFANPSAVLQLATQKRAELEKRSQVAGLVIERALRRNAALAPSLIPFVPREYQSYFLLDLVQKSDDAATRDENLAQVLALTRRLEGDEAATGTGGLAMYLLQAGDRDLATDLVNDIFDNQQKDFEAVTDQKSKRGVARYFFPQLALVDFDKACELIHKHAYPNEIGRLQTLALAIAVMADKTDWKTGLQKLGRTSLAEHESTLVPGLFGETPLPDEKFVESLLEQVSSERTKAMLCMQATIKLPNVSTSVRQKWLNRGVEYLLKAKGEFPSFYAETLAYLLRDKLPKLGESDPSAARQIAFVCLEELSEFRDGEYFYLADRAGFVAEALSGVEPELSRTLLKPFLDDFSWHYRIGFRTPPNPLTSAAKLDPEWARTIAEQLIDGELRDDKLRQTEILHGTIDGLAVGH